MFAMLRVKPFAWLDFRYLCALALALPLVGTLQPAAAATRFSLISSPQSWIVAGEHITVTPEDGYDFSGFVFDSVATFSIDNIRHLSDGRPSNWWTLDLAAPLAQSLTISSYTDASKYPYQSSAQSGLNFEGNGRGNSAVTGSFDVLEAIYRANGEILSFAADFLQYDEGIPEWWNKGAIRINSQVPILLIPKAVNGEPAAESGPVDGSLPTPPNGSQPSPDDQTVLVPTIPDLGQALPPSPNLPVEEPDQDFFILTPVPLPEDPDASGSTLWPIINPGLRTLPPDDFPPDGSLNGGHGTTPPDPAPGPLPVAAALAGWQTSRLLRQRCRASR